MKTIVGRYLFLFSLLFCISAWLTAQPQRRYVIVDQDAKGAGSEGSGAIVFVLQNPDITTLGITIESGDGWEKEEEAHTLRLLELIGRTDVVVVPGASLPLINNIALTRRWEGIYGRLGYKGAMTDKWPSDDTHNRQAYHDPDVVPPIPEGSPSIKPSSEIAANFMVRMVHEHPGQVSILALGPVTNIAIACVLDPQFALIAKELILMGGSLNPPARKPDMFANQSRFSPRISFNLRWDPEASAITLRAPWKKIVLVTGEASGGVPLSRSILDAGARSGSAAGLYMKKWNTKSGIPLWDPATAAIYIDPTLISKMERIVIDIDLERGANYGALLTWPEERRPDTGEPIADVVLAIEEERFTKMFINAMNAPVQSAHH